MPRFALLAFLILSALLAAPGSAMAAIDRQTVLDIDDSGPANVDLDGDGSFEQVTAAVQSDGFNRIARLQYACGTRIIGPRNERIAVDTLRPGGSTAAPLLSVFGSSGATGRIQTTWVHKLVPAATAGECPRLVTVFRFPHRTTPVPRPPRGTSAGSFSAAPREVGGQIWFRTTEGLYRATDAGCCPSFVRTIDWKPRGDRYVRAKTRVRRLPRP